MQSSAIRFCKPREPYCYCYCTEHWAAATAFATGQVGDNNGCLNGSFDSSLNATNTATFGTQFVGTISVVLFSFVLSYLVFVALKQTTGLRISKAAEKLGTDKAEIGVVAYSIRD